MDRILAARLLDERAAPAPPGAATAAFSPSEHDPRVTLELAPSASWVVETYPTEEVVAADDGTLRVRLAIAEPAFLESLLLRLGAAARVVEAAPTLADAGRRAAERVLARYR